MKRLRRRTPYIILKAETNSQWDHVGFAIIASDLFTDKHMLSRVERLRSLRLDPLFSSICYDELPYGFWAHAGPKDEWVETFLMSNLNWSYVQMEEEEMNRFEPPENRLCYHQLILTSSEDFYFKAEGKHTGESFWTVSLPIKILLDQ